MSDSQLDGMFRLLGILPAETRLQMVRMYSDALVGQIDLLRECIARADVQDCASVAHKIAGSAAMMQDQQLSRAAREMERALLAGELEKATLHWPQTQACAAFTLESLGRHYPGAG